jgi:hypothetical protein
VDNPPTRELAMGFGPEGKGAGASYYPQGPQSGPHPIVAKGKVEAVGSNDLAF